MNYPGIPTPADEAERQAALESYRILDTEPEEVYDDIVTIASQICDAPIALITLLDGDRQWFKARHGLDATGTHRREAFCSYTIMGDGPMVVRDATADERFADNPVVTGEMGIRFYAGAPLRTPDGHGLGSLCVIDTTPRDIDADQVTALERLSRMVVRQLELHRATHQLGDALERVETLSRLLPICSFCRRVRRDDDFWQEFEEFLEEETGTVITHGLCPDCAESEYPTDH